MAQYENPLDGDIVINDEDEVSLIELAHALVLNPGALDIIARAVRDAQTRGLARRNSNIYGLTAQAPTPTQNPRRIS